MGFWDEGRDAHDQVYHEDPDNKASFGHQFLAGAASFAAVKMFEDRQERNGEVVSHKFAKEAIAGLAGVEADRLAESYGKNEWERHEAKKEAERRSEEMYDSHYGGQENYNPSYGRHERMQDARRGNYYNQDGY